MARRDHLQFYTDLLVESKQGLTCVVIYIHTDVVYTISIFN